MPTVMPSIQTVLRYALAFVLLTGCDDRSNATTDEASLSSAETFVDAFYSFDREHLVGVLSLAKDSIPEIVYYQGWAVGGNYKVLERKPCVRDGATTVSCSIKVKDDLMGALGIPFDVTDTFHLTFSKGNIVAVKTSSNDLEVFGDAEKWVRRTRPELISEPCKGYFDGGPTPELCVQAMVRGYAEFARSDEFPEVGLAELPK